MSQQTDYDNPPLSVAKMDIERRIGFPSGRHTQPGPVLPLLVAVLLGVGFYAALIPLEEFVPRLAESM